MMMTIRHTGIGRLGDQSITDIITQAAQAQGVPVSLALAQAQHESGLDPNAIGLKGEIGLFQLRPEYFGQMGDLTDPTINANVALWYLYQQYQHTGNNWRDALIAYNEGPTAWDQGNRYASSQSYADDILAAAGVIGGGVTTTAPPPAPAPTPLPLPVTQPQTQPVTTQPGNQPGTQPVTQTDWTTIGLVAIAGVVAVNLMS